MNSNSIIDLTMTVCLDDCYEMAASNTSATRYLVSATQNYKYKISTWVPLL